MLSLASARAFFTLAGDVTNMKSFTFFGSDICFTAIVRGKNNTTGIGLVEAYNLQ